MIKSKNLLIKQGNVYGVKTQSKMTAVGAPSNAVMNLKNTQNKRRKFVQNAKSNFNPEARIAIREFEAWQMKVFKKNYKKGWRFFQPDAFDRPTPRSAREAWGAPYKHDDTDKKELRNQKIMFAIVVGVLLILATL
jgi:hypothetical protein